ncbi:ferric reductase like transmembrane component [Sclerotinia borealis F-4128]|uniref:Ferric reductase like transmembrane component n=1 Tax=Sclerotinia borealis (strain F-4128) TaxID=1432307 RepID=W9CE61_SCLBF|nr:ferric reductase like transmembrane component [Sclerotinia borealis F-4128]
MTIRVTFFILFIFFDIYHVSATDYGIIGFGLSLYQDLCCQACHDSLSSLYLTCTTFENSDDTSMDMSMSSDMAMEIMTSDECYATNIPWLQTMAYCIQQNCDADGYSAEKQAKCFSTQAVAGAPKPTFQDSLPATAPTDELSEDALWLNVTSLVNSNTYYATHGTEKEFARSEYIHTRYSLIKYFRVMLYLIVIGICVGTGILAQARSIFPRFQKQMNYSTLWAKLQQHIFLPSLLGSRHLEPLPGNVGYLPGRILSIFIGIYIALNVVLSSVSFRTFFPNTFFAAPQFELCEYVGNRTGTLSLVNMSISTLFAGRNNILINLTGWGQSTFITLHRWTARVAVLQAVVHSICYTVAYFEPGSGGAAAYVAKIAEPFYWWGIIATVALSLVIAFASLPLRIKFYEVFVITHIILIILALVGCWYHLVPHFGSVFGYQVWLYIAFAFWSADRLARLVRVAYYNHLGNSRAIVEAIPNCDIMQVSVFPRVPWDFGPGQHTFLYVPELGRFWESHPFSIAGWRRQEHPQSTSVSTHDVVAEGEGVNETVSMARESGSQTNLTAGKQQTMVQHQSQTQTRASVHFLIRPHSGMTSALRRRLLSSPSSSSMETSIYIEGPYAGHRATLQPLLIADTIVCLVGGIGITNALGFIQEYTHDRKLDGEREGHESSERTSRSRIMKKATRFILAWSAKEMALIEFVRSKFLAQDIDGGLDTIDTIEQSFWCTGSSSTAADAAAQEGDSININDTSKELPRSKVSETMIMMGRMDIAAVIKSSVEKGQQTAILVCGPGRMADEATREVVMCVKNGFRVDLVEESFAW